MSQTTFTEAPAVAKAGMISESAYQDIISRANDAAIEMGLGVVVDDGATTPEHNCKVPAATGEITGGTFLGITVWDTGIESDGATGYEANSVVSILRRGRVWVEVEAAVAVGGAVFCRFVADGEEKLGAFRDDADTADAVAVPGAVYLTAAGDGELALVELNPTR